MMMPEEVRKIAVLRANGLGDFLFALPALESLRAAFPQAEIVLLGLPWHVSFLEGRPSPVDRRSRGSGGQGIREEAGLTENEGVLSAFFARHGGRALRHRLPDARGRQAFKPVRNAPEGALFRGFASAGRTPLDLWMPYVYFQPEILRYLEVARLAGAQAVTHEPALAVTEADISESMSAVGGADGPIAAIVPGGGDGRRRWPQEKLAAVGDGLPPRACGSSFPA